MYFLYAPRFLLPPIHTHELVISTHILLFSHLICEVMYVLYCIVICLIQNCLV